jgi:hypothetical protein
VGLGRLVGPPTVTLLDGAWAEARRGDAGPKDGDTSSRLFAWYIVHRHIAGSSSSGGDVACLDAYESLCGYDIRRFRAQEPRAGEGAGCRHAVDDGTVGGARMCSLLATRCSLQRSAS